MSLLVVLNGNGAGQEIIVCGRETTVDRSDTITATNASQTLMDANENRSGWTLQNQSARDMWLNELGDASNAAPSIKVPAGASISAPKDFPLTVGEICITGTIGDAFAAREW